MSATDIRDKGHAGFLAVEKGLLGIIGTLERAVSVLERESLIQL